MTAVHDIVLSDRPYETYIDMSHKAVMKVFGGELHRKQGQLEMCGGPGTQVELGFTG